MSDIGRDAFEQYIRDYSPNMYRLALAMLHSREDAEDAVSEAVLAAYEKRRTLRSHGSFKPWIMQITANEACVFLVTGKFPMLSHAYIHAVRIFRHLE